MIGHFEEKNEIKYLVLDNMDENKEVLKKYKEVLEGVKKEIETINGGEKIEYGQDFKTIRSVFSEDGKFYSQFFFLDDAL